MKKKGKFIHIPGSEWSNVNSWSWSNRGKDIVIANKSKLDKNQEFLRGTR